MRAQYIVSKKIRHIIRWNEREKAYCYKKKGIDVQYETREYYRYYQTNGEGEKQESDA